MIGFGGSNRYLICDAFAVVMRTNSGVVAKLEDDLDVAAIRAAILPKPAPTPVQSSVSRCVSVSQLIVGDIAHVSAVER